MKKEKGRIRVVIENVKPEIDAGLFPIKRIKGDEVKVEADIFTDGHEEISCMLFMNWGMNSITDLNGSIFP